MNGNGTTMVLAGFLLAVSMVLHPAGAGESVWDRGSEKPGKPVDMTVYRSPTCGCCGKWLEHMQRHGFVVQDIKTVDMDAIKQKYGVPQRLRSCHTAVVDGYVIEGHVPAPDVRELLRKHPDVAGLAVPRMPSGAPGMEMGGRKDPFAVLELDRKGQVRTFREYSGY